MARGVLVSLGHARALVVHARCITGECYLVFTSFSGSPLLAVAPAQPNPFCIQAPREAARLVLSALEAAGAATGYRIPICIVPTWLIPDSIETAIEKLMELGVIREVLPPAAEGGR